MTRFVGQTADASLRQNCSLPTRRRPWGQWLQSDFQQIKTDEAQSRSEPHHLSSYISVCDFSLVQFHFGEGQKKKFLNVCFKDSSSAFQVFGCFFLLCVEVHSLFQDFCITKKKKKKDFSCSEFNTLGWQTYHYSQIGISSLISADLKLKLFLWHC